MTRSDLYAFLTSRFGLVTDPGERGVGQTYFLGAVEWRPGRTTRILRAQLAGDEVVRIRLCVSSDNNNSVFVAMPADLERLARAVGEEIAVFGARSGTP